MINITGNELQNKRDIKTLLKGRLNGFNELGVFIALIILCIVVNSINPLFFTTKNVLNVLRQISTTAIIAVAMAFVVITGGIDLSVGSFLCIGGLLCAKLTVMGVNPWVALLMKVIRRLKSAGTCIIYVSHRIEEIMRIADRITVFRDGKFISTSLVSETTQDKIISEMVGRDLSNQLECLTHYEPHFERSNVVQEVRDLTSQNHFENISFNLYKGEILGFGGLVGAGRTELVESIFGIETSKSGEVYLFGKKTDIRHPKDAIAKRVGLVSEERKVKGLFLKLSVRENINIPLRKAERL